MARKQQKGKGPGPSVKDPEVYEALRDEGASKEKAARIANAAAAQGRSKVGERGGEAADYDDRTVAELLKSAGYATGLVGKWHAGSRKEPADYGLDGVHTPGWHNPVDHPDYLAYLEERGLPPYRISDRVRGTLPNG